jgi:hypothetical protein
MSLVELSYVLYILLGNSLIVIRFKSFCPSHYICQPIWPSSGVYNFCLMETAMPPFSEFQSSSTCMLSCLCVSVWAGYAVSCLQAVNTLWFPNMLHNFGRSTWRCQNNVNSILRQCSQLPAPRISCSELWEVSLEFVILVFQAFFIAKYFIVEIFWGQ